MKKLYVYLFLLTTSVGFAQLTVKPNTSSGSDNYLYVDGTVLFVKSDIALTENADTDIANIYLRNQAQLIQGSESVSTNTGSGSLSIFQEGTTDAFAYNYWASPVGNPGPGDTGGNSAFTVSSFSVPTSRLLSNDASMIGGYNSTTTSGGNLNLAKYWIYKYVSPDGSAPASWTHVKTQKILNAGEGFTMKGVNGTDSTVVDGTANNSGSNQRYDFRGRPNDGVITVPATSANESILIGNPFPSAIDLNYFLIENSAVKDNDGNIVPTAVNSNCTASGEVSIRRDATTGVAYFWSSDPSVQSHNIADYVGGYANYSPNNSCSGNGVYTPPTFYNYNNNNEAVDGSGNVQSVDDKQFRRFLPVGQGFFVQSTNTETEGSDPTFLGDDIQFKNFHRRFVKEGTSNLSVFGRNAVQSDNPSFVVDEEENAVPKIRFNFSFNDQYTRQIALAFDEEATNGVDTARDAVSFNFLASDAGFLMNQTSYNIDIRPFDEDGRIPLYLWCSEQKNLEIKVYEMENFDTENVFLYDKDTEIYHPIKDNTLYLSLPAGDYAERFEITFKNEDEEELSVADEIAESFTVFQDNRLGQFEILNPKGVDLKSVSLFDMTGKQIMNNLNVGTNNRYTFPTTNLSDAVYIVRILTADNITTTKKISILNRG
jgi:hypothetical protein